VKSDTTKKSGPDLATGVGSGTPSGNSDNIKGESLGSGGGAAAGGGGRISDQPKKRFREFDAGSGSPRRTGSGFPSGYANVRKFREKSNPFIELPTPCGNRQKEAVGVRTVPGFDLLGDSQQHNVNNFHVPSL
jgi:hypothetical protein